MLDQYCPPPMASLFTDRARLARWLQVELAVLDAQESLGHVPPGAGATARGTLPAIDEQFAAEVSERRLVTGHEMAAFVDVLGRRLGPSSRWLHFGLTSADVIDTANGLLLTRAAGLLDEALEGFRQVLARRAREFDSAPIMGRTHGMFAEPTTFGAKVALWALRVGRDRDRLAVARKAVAVGSLSGPVGNYANIDPRAEAMACASLGLEPAVNAQFVARDRYAEYVWACASIGSTIEHICTGVRLLHASEVAEVRELFRDGQKGSSSMPHKENPSVSMELCGLSRVLRGYLVTSMENTAVWHEGDTTALAAERVVLPHVSNLTFYAIGKAASLVESLVIDQAAMLEKFERARGLPLSSSVMHVLIQAGMDRDAAYRMMQAAAAEALAQGVTLREAFAGQPITPVPDERLDEAFSLDHALRNAHVITSAVPPGGTG